MNVTAANASTVLEEWQGFVDRCEFYTVDQEMTGIDGGEPLDKEGPLSKLFGNVSTAVKRYSAFQFGICLFERKEKKGSAASSSPSLGDASEYIVRPFSFWLLNDNSDLTLGTGSVKFLVANNMNYQFWLSNGFDYGTQDWNECPKNEELTDAEKKWIAETFEALNNWHDNPPPAPLEEKGTADGTEEPPKKQPTLEKNLGDEFFLNSFVSSRADLYLHYMLYAQTTHLPLGYAVPEHIKASQGRQTPFNAAPTKSLANGRPPRFPRVWFHRVNPSTENPIAPINGRALKAKPTFHPFYKVLLESKKPHIGHNYFTDLMFQIHQHHMPLPDSFEVFRKLLKDTFPSLYDTKVLSEMCVKPPKNSSLGFVFSEFSDRARKAGLAKKFKFPLGFNDLTSKDNKCAHDGAYDAFMTGVVFLYVLSMSPAVNSSNVGSEVQNAIGAVDGIPEGYLTYEGVVAQFGSNYWLALRRDEDVMRGPDSRYTIMGFEKPLPPPPAEEETAEKKEY